MHVGLYLLISITIEHFLIFAKYALVFIATYRADLFSVFVVVIAYGLIIRIIPADIFIYLITVKF